MFLFPWSNFHELNLDWVIKMVKSFADYLNSIGTEIKKEIAEQIKELVDSGYFKDLVDEEALKGIVNKVDNIVSIKNIKIKNPGMNDDDLLDEALKEAQKNGINSVIKWDGENINFQRAHTVTGISGIDFNNSSIKLASKNFIALTIKNDEQEESYVLNCSDIVQNVVNDNHLQGKIFTLNGTVAKTFGIRNGGTENLIPTWCISADENGNFTNVNVSNTYFPNSGTTTAVNIHTYPKNHFIIENATVYYDGSNTTVAQLIRMERSNSEVRNIKVEGSVPSSGNYKGTIISFNFCFNVIARNICGINPIQDEDSGYVISSYAASNLLYDSCMLGDINGGSWGDTANDWGSNIKYTSCCMGRCDSHYAQWGYYIACDCTLGYFTFGVGACDILVERCNFIVSSTDIVPISKRGDIGGLIEGTIEVNACRVSGYGGAVNYFMTYVCGAKNVGQTITMTTSRATINIKNIISNAKIFLLLGGSEGQEIWSEHVLNIDNISYVNTDGILIGTNGINNFWRFRLGTITNSVINCKQLLRGNIAFLAVKGCVMNSPIFTECNSTVQDSGKALAIIESAFPGFVTNNLNLNALTVIGCNINTNSNNNRNGVTNYYFEGNLAPAGGKSFWNSNNQT